MKHARSDYNSIQDASGRIPEDEPVFLIRARDIVGPGIVREHGFRAQRAGADATIVRAILAQADAMAKYAEANGGYKIPDMPADAEQ